MNLCVHGVRGRINQCRSLDPPGWGPNLQTGTQTGFTGAINQHLKVKSWTKRQDTDYHLQHNTEAALSTL